MSSGRPGRRRWDLALAACLAAFFLFAIVLALGFPDSQVFPLAIAIPGLVLAVLQAAISLGGADTEVAARFGAGPSGGGLEEEEETPVAVRVRRTLRIAAWVVAAFALVWLIGFQWTFPLLALGYLRFESGESWVATVAVALICFLFVWGVFDQLLHVPLPPGVLLRALGLG